MSTPISSTIGELRQATPEEILKAATQVNTLQDWQRALDFARSIYGDQVHMAKLVIDHNFDDGKENRYLVTIEGYDQQGNQLPYDFSLPFWSQEGYDERTLAQRVEHDMPYEIERIKKYRRKPGDLTEEELAQAREGAVRDVLHDSLPEIKDLDCTWNEFSVDRPPLSN